MTGNVLSRGRGSRVEREVRSVVRIITEMLGDHLGVGGERGL